MEPKLKERAKSVTWAKTRNTQFGRSPDAQADFHSTRNYMFTNSFSFVNKNSFFGDLLADLFN